MSSVPNNGVTAPGIESQARRDIVEASGRLFQLLGLPRSTGQIYGLLYLSERPLSLDDLVDRLSISKGSASIGTRQLASWGAVRQVWIPGDRRDHFEAMADLGELLRAGFAAFFKTPLSSSEKRLASIAENLQRDFQGGLLNSEEYEFCSERLRSLQQFHGRIQSIAPIAEQMLGTLPQAPKAQTEGSP